MKNRITAIFLIEKNGDKENVLAVLNTHDGENRVCYAHVGQHSIVSDEYISLCRNAKYAEYRALLIEMAKMYNIIVKTDEVITVSRNPTYYEIKKGYGARHFIDVNLSLLIKMDGKLKKRFLHNDDKLFYSR